MPVLPNGAPLVTRGRTTIMGIINVTPDSFSDGGLFTSVGKAVDHASRMIDDGADMLDLGGESTRPGASAVSLQQELDRVVPVIEALSARFQVPISIDTSKAEVMQHSVSAGAAMVNDVRALREEGAMAAAVSCAVPVCIMHMLGEPRTMQENPQYDDVVDDVKTFLAERVEACVDAGMAAENIILDPGFGFGKTMQQNFELLRRLEEIRYLDLPILAGLSRKSMIGHALDLPVDQRQHASVGLALMAVWNGANIVRVHDVKETSDALRMIEAVQQH